VAQPPHGRRIQDMGAPSIRDQQRSAAIDAYLEHHPQESRRLDAVLSRARLAAGQDAARLADLTAQVRGHLISIANLDHAEQAAPSAATRLRQDLSEYLLTIEGLRAPAAWP